MGSFPTPTEDTIQFLCYLINLAVYVSTSVKVLSC